MLDWLYPVDFTETIAHLGVIWPKTGSFPALGRRSAGNCGGGRKAELTAPNDGRLGTSLRDTDGATLSPRYPVVAGAMGAAERSA